MSDHNEAKEYWLSAMLRRAADDMRRNESESRMIFTALRPETLEVAAEQIDTYRDACGDIDSLLPPAERVGDD